MIDAIRSEFRKLFTVRTTYIYILFAMLIVALFAGFGEGFKASPALLKNPGLLASEVTNAVGFVGIFAALAGLLLLAQEYRFNTIMYTLTASNSRTKVLVAKVFVVSIFAIGFTLLIGAFSPLCTLIGIHLQGSELVPQTLYYNDLLWRCLFYGWAYSMIALAIAAIVRHLVGSIVALLVFPAVVENILSLLLKGNDQYLPFRALGSVVGMGMPGSLSPGKAAVTVGIYLVVLWLVAWVLFLRRDAN